MATLIDALEEERQRLATSDDAYDHVMAQVADSIIRFTRKDLYNELPPAVLANHILQIELRLSAFARAFTVLLKEFDTQVNDAGEPKHDDVGDLPEPTELDTWEWRISHINKTILAIKVTLGKEGHRLAATEISNLRLDLATAQERLEIAEQKRHELLACQSR